MVFSADQTTELNPLSATDIPTIAPTAKIVDVSELLSFATLLCCNSQLYRQVQSYECCIVGLKTHVQEDVDQSTVRNAAERWLAEA